MNRFYVKQTLDCPPKHPDWSEPLYYYIWDNDNLNHFGDMQFTSFIEAHQACFLLNLTAHHENIG